MNLSYFTEYMFVFMNKKLSDSSPPFPSFRGGRLLGKNVKTPSATLREGVRFFPVWTSAKILTFDKGTFVFPPDE
jgi:hypothetical protein